MAANEQRQEEQREPAHHARRPMNAFLIFCKRHRGSVRSGFPHLENRAVTRVLGEWWATLHPDQKRCYTNLAQEYKDAFLNANPDFKWYKLPAPPLRTLTTRPTNKKTEFDTGEPGQDLSSTESDLTKIDKREGQSIQPGKLADESQIGGLSSLFTPLKAQTQETVPIINGNNDQLNVNENISVPKPPKKRYTELPHPVIQKREIKVDLFGEKKKESNNNNNQPSLGAEIEKNGNNLYYEGTGSPEESGFRGERTCKGLRYQKFLAEQVRAVGPTGQQTRRRRAAEFSSPEEQTIERRNSISSNFSEKTDSVSSEGSGSTRGELEHLVESAEGKLEASKPEETETEEAGGQLHYDTWTPRKRFKAEDFNLEKKIEALPSLSLEEFQEKKKQQRTKKKKIVQKLNSNASSRKQSNSSTNTQSLDGMDKALLVGSQKRKARKQSITRNAGASGAVKGGDDQDTKEWGTAPDLGALACLAAVAADRTKLMK
ncbi:transcription factor Sox-11 isoform X2 [Athalia rosae]|uniref:transcription factor Sox-11 isoform X2 n=1 Tax=Athalia rosae TaxID=37344 RepID=UPI0006254665|nr:transcription factor Sox-11 isoform X2 [Athalia rosae]